MSTLVHLALSSSALMFIATSAASHAHAASGRHRAGPECAASSKAKALAAWKKKLAAIVRAGAGISAAHGRLANEARSQRPVVQKALAPHKAKLQSITAGTGKTVFDEYWIVLDKMPAKITPEAYLAEMATDLNKAVSSTAFNAINKFKRTKQDRDRGAPAVGDIYDIDVLGPDNGSVMLAEKGRSYFIFQTVTTKQTGTHPENGSREFGFQKLKNGAVRWYTRGASRPGMALTGAVGRPIQTASWTAMLKGIGNALAKRGGKLRPKSFGHWIKRR